MGSMTVDDSPIPTDSTPADNLDLSHVTVRSISNRRFSIPIKVETVENTEEITALINCGAEGLFMRSEFNLRASIVIVALVACASTQRV